MPLRPEKRRFLVSVLGEERTAALEKMLPEMEARLEQSGIGWKEVGSLREVMIGYTDVAEAEAEVVAVVTPVGPLTMADAEMEQEVREEGYEVQDLLHVFRAVFDNVMAAPPEAGEKLKLLTGLLKELKTRLGKLGEGQKSLANPAAPYIQDLTGGGAGAKSADPTVEAEAKRLRDGGGPAGAIVGDLLINGAVSG